MRPALPDRGRRSAPARRRQMGAGARGVGAGGKRGLIVLSAGLCKSPKASVSLTGQNGKAYDTDPLVKTSCPKKHKKQKHSKAKR